MVGFFTPISGGDHSSTRFPVVEFFDNYFDFSDKKLKVITAGASSHYLVYEFESRANKISKFLI